MGKSNILIIGATGMIGGKIVNSFIESGFNVKILTRNITKAQKKLGENLSYFEGDVLVKNSLINVFTDIDGIYIHLNDFNEDTLHKTFVDGVRNIVELAKFQRLNRIIFQSSSMVNEKYKWFASVAAMIESEDILKNSGLNYTILKPGYFMEAIKFFLRGNQASIIGEGKYKYNWIAGDEFAKDVVNIYENESYIEKTYYLFGPESLSLEEALKKYCDILKPNAKFNSLSHEMMHSISRFSNNKKMSYMADFIKFMDSASDHFNEIDEDDNVIMLKSSIDNWLEKQYTTH